MFDAEATRKIASEECARVIGKARYDPDDASRVAGEITEGIIERVSEYHGGHCKILTHCTYMRDVERTFDMFAVNMWDVPNDGLVVYEHTNGKVKVILCVWCLKC